MKQSRVLTGILFAVVFAAWLGVPRLTQAVGTTQVTVSPVTFDLTANPGDKLTNDIKVTNFSDGALQLETKLENIAQAGEEGQVELTEGTTPFALSNWLKTDPAHFSLGPKETKIIHFTIDVPANAEPGGHYGTVLIGTTAGGAIDSTGAIITQRVGPLVLVRVSGQAKEAASIAKFTVRHYEGSWDEVTASDGKTKVLIAKDEPAVSPKPALYFAQGPLAFDVLVHNSGNVHVKPTGVVSIYNLFNHKVADLPIDAHNVFPGSDRKLTILWPQKKLWGGFYHAKLVAIYGAPNQTLTADITFWAFPKAAAITVGLVLFMGIILRRRLTKALHVLIKGA